MVQPTSCAPSRQFLPERPEAHDLSDKPWVVIWELTQACDLACLHCRANARAGRHRDELTTRESKRLLDDIAATQPRVLVLTGGDPLKRADLMELVRHAVELGLQPALTPSATPLLTKAVIGELAEAGVARFAISLDGATAATHDRFRGVTGSFDLTMEGAREVIRLGLPLQINTTATRLNREELPRIARLLEELGIAMWSVFFTVPTGRAQRSTMLDADETEAVFDLLFEVGSLGKFLVRTTEALHYRRYLLQRKSEVGPTAPALRWASRNVPRGISDGTGFMFISHTGEVFPSGFLPLSAGNVRHEKLLDIYHHSALFTTLHDRTRLKGKCGVCEFRNVCGGSRARAYACTGDWLESDPVCNYEPAQWARVAGAAPEVTIRA